VYQRHYEKLPLALSPNIKLYEEDNKYVLWNACIYSIEHLYSTVMLKFCVNCFPTLNFNEIRQSTAELLPTNDIQYGVHLPS